MRFAIAACVLLMGMNANACDCKEPPEPKKALDAAGAVFLAEADKVVVEGDTRIVTFKVERWWKGGDKAEVTAFTHKDGATCGYRFEKGKKYLVYARMDKDKIHVSLRSRTRTEKAAEESADFKELGEGKKPTIASNEPRRRSDVGAAIAEAGRIQNSLRDRERMGYIRTLQRVHEAWQTDGNRHIREMLERIPPEPPGWNLRHLSPNR